MNRVLLIEAVARVIKNELNRKLREKVKELKLPLEVLMESGEKKKREEKEEGRKRGEGRGEIFIHIIMQNANSNFSLPSLFFLSLFHRSHTDNSQSTF